jgi:hypothetical protein
MRGYRRAVATATVLAATAGLTVAVAPAAEAADSCTSEQGTLGPIGACDDTDPPDTTITGTDPRLQDGWVRATSVSISFGGAYDDADTDPISFECQFDQPASSTTWQACTSPFTAGDLTPNRATPYTFRVRAVDSADDAIDLASPVFGGTDVPDYDQTAAEVSFTADDVAPNTFGFLRTTYADESGFDGPMLVAPRARLRLQSTQGSRYRCALDGTPIACHDGLTTLRGLTAGWRRFTAAAVDPAGNVDPSPFAQRFFVPRDLVAADAARGSHGEWRRFRDPGAFGGDYLESSTYGAVLAFPVRGVREIRLLAPAGPQLGRVAIRVGRGRWYPVDLRSDDTQRLRVYQVRDALSPRVAGTLQVRVLSHGRPVRVDAVSAR